MKLQEWIAVACNWLGITDPFAISVATGALTAALLCVIIAYLMYLIVIIVSIFGGR